MKYHVNSIKEKNHLWDIKTKTIRSFVKRSENKDNIEIYCIKPDQIEDCLQNGE